MASTMIKNKFIIGEQLAYGKFTFEQFQLVAGCEMKNVSESFLNASKFRNIFFL